MAPKNLTVTVDDALDVMEQEADEDLAIATGRSKGSELAGVWRWVSHNGWLAVWAVLFLAAAAVSRTGGADDSALRARAAGRGVYRCAAACALGGAMGLPGWRDQRGDRVPRGAQLRVGRAAQVKLAAIRRTF